MPSFPDPFRPRLHSTAALAVLAALALGAAGCVPDEPEPEPEPTPTGFASEEEALEAARATYEGYIDATNSLDLTKDDSLAAVYLWLSGSALADTKVALSEAQAEGTYRTGESLVTKFQMVDTDLVTKDARAEACLDVSRVEVLSASGESLVSDERIPIQSIALEFEASSHTPTGLTISTSGGRDRGLSCDE